jgi:hypothetical protein
MGGEGEGSMSVAGNVQVVGPGGGGWGEGRSRRGLLYGGEVSDVHVLSKLKENQNWREKLCLLDVECKRRQLIVRRLVWDFIMYVRFL